MRNNPTKIESQFMRDAVSSPLRDLMARLAILTAAFVIAGCSSLPLIGGDNEPEVDEGEAPPEEERISIMTLEQKLSADPRYAELNIELPASYVNRNWAQPGGEPDNTFHHLQASGELDVLWKRDIGKGSSVKARLTAPPIVADGRVYVMDAGAKVVALDLESGDELWKADLNPRLKERRNVVGRIGYMRTKPASVGFGGGVAFMEGVVFATSGFGFVAALNAETGEELWRTDVIDPVRTAPVAVDGRVFAITNSNRLVAISSEDGALLWEHQALAEPARILAATTVAVAGDLVVAPFSSGEMIAFRAANGRAVWEDTVTRTTRMTALSSLNDIAARPLIDRGRVIAVSHAGRMVAVDIRSGQRVWENNVGGVHTPWVAGEYIFSITPEAELVCTSRRDGAIIWVTELPQYKNEKKKKNRISWAGPILVSGNLILISTHGRALTVSPNSGDILGERKFEPSFVTPVLAQETLLILGENGVVYALR